MPSCPGTALTRTGHTRHSGTPTHHRHVSSPIHSDDLAPHGQEYSQDDEQQSDDDQLFEVERILKHRVGIELNDRSSDPIKFDEYRIKWKNYPIEEATWQRGDILAPQIPDMIKDFRSRNAATIRRNWRRSQPSPAPEHHFSLISDLQTRLDPIA